MIVTIILKLVINIKNIKIIKIDNGYYYFKLGSILKEKNVSINKLMRDTENDYKVIKRLITGDLLRVNIIVLARLCNYLDCEMTDIIDYKKEDNLVTN